MCGRKLDEGPVTIVLLVAAILSRILGTITITALQCIYAYALTIAPPQKLFVFHYAVAITKSL